MEENLRIQTLFIIVKPQPLLVLHIIYFRCNYPLWEKKLAEFEEVGEEEMIEY